MVLEEVSHKGTYLSEESNLTILKQIPLLSDHRPGHSLLFLTALSYHPLGRLLPLRPTSPLFHGATGSPDDDAV